MPRCHLSCVKGICSQGKIMLQGGKTFPRYSWSRDRLPKGLGCMICIIATWCVHVNPYALLFSGNILHFMKISITSATKWCKVQPFSVIARHKDIYQDVENAVSQNCYKKKKVHECMIVMYWRAVFRKDTTRKWTRCCMIQPLTDISWKVYI
jgi:hypothetical protein